MIPSPTDLAALVEAALSEGRLPAKKADRLYGGQGVAASCAVCSRPIPLSVVAYEAEFDGDGRQFHVHLDCYAAWQRRVLEA